MTDNERDSGPTPEKIYEGIHPRILEALPHQYRDALEALLELTDNSYDDRIEGKPLLLYLNVKKDEILINDCGGSGMGFEELKNFFQWGFSERMQRLGRYGFGGKAAMGYLAKSFRILSAREGEDLVYEIEEQNWDDRTGGLKEYTPVIKNRKGGHGFVQIELSNLKRELKVDQVSQRLAKTYRRALHERKIVIIVNGEKVEPLEIPLLGEPIPFCFSLSDGQRVEGWFGKLDTERKPEIIKPGMNGCVFGRLITEGIFFDYPDPLAEPALNQFIGEFNIDSANFPLLPAKTDFDRGSKQWQELQSEVKKVLDPFIAQFMGKREPERAPKGDGPVFENALRIVRLGFVELGLIDRGRKKAEKPKHAGKFVEGTRVPMGKARIPETAIPKSGEVVGRLARLPYPIKFVSRNLGPGIRSALIEEDGIKKLLICPDYDCYRASRQQGGGTLILFLLETAALELAKMTLAEGRTEITPERYVREANDLLRVFIKAGKKAKII